MKIFFAIILLFTLSACGEDEVRQQGYDEGYGVGLEEQRVHICNKIEYADDHAFEVLQDERICP